MITTAFGLPGMFFAVISVLDLASVLTEHEMLSASAPCSGDVLGNILVNFLALASPTLTFTKDSYLKPTLQNSRGASTTTFLLYVLVVQLFPCL